MKDPFDDIRVLDDENELVCEHLIELYGKWNHARHGAFAPGSLDLLDCPELLPCCCVLDVRGCRSILDGVFKFAGSFAVTIADREVTGLQLSSLNAFAYMIRLVATSGTGRCATYTRPHQIAYEPKSNWIVQEVCLPLSRDGEVVSELVYAFSPTDRLSRADLKRAGSYAIETYQDVPGGPIADWIGQKI